MNFLGVDLNHIDEIMLNVVKVGEDEMT